MTDRVAEALRQRATQVVEEMRQKIPRLEAEIEELERRLSAIRTRKP